MPSDPRRRLAPFTSAALDGLATISAADIEDATRTFRADAPRAVSGLLDATVPTPAEDVRAATVAKVDTAS